jgi:hypothetical protein
MRLIVTWRNPVPTIIRRKKIMRNIAFAIAVVTAASAGMVAHAQDTKSAGKEVQANKNKVDTTEFDKQLRRMQENINRMQQQMAKIRQTQDPQERQKLLQEHWTTMQSAMATMQTMGGIGMMGGGRGMMGGGPGGRRGMGMGWGNMGPYYSELTPEQQKQREYMVDQKLRIHQLMMEQMLQQQQWMWQSPDTSPKK